MLASGRRDAERREGTGEGVFKKEKKNNENAFDKETPISHALGDETGLQTSQCILAEVLLFQVAGEGCHIQHSLQGQGPRWVSRRRSFQETKLPTSRS